MGNNKKNWRVNMNLGRNLPLNEAKMTKAQFLEYIKANANADPKHFKVGNVVIENDFGPNNWPVIVGEHALKRLHQRTYMRPDAIVSKAIEVLSMPLVGTEVIKHQVIWDDDQGQAVDFDGDGIMATVVEPEAESLALTFEAGANYISLLTIWSGNVWRTRTRDCEIVFISKEGSISFHDCVSTIRG